MTQDFYCDEILSGKTVVEKVCETKNVLAYYHTKPSYKVHIVVFPKRHVSSLTTLTENDHDLLIEMIEVIRKVAANVEADFGACRVITNLGAYQDSKHLHWHVVSGEKVKWR